MLVGTHTFDFTRHMNKLFIYMDWGTDAKENEYLLLEVYKTVDPDNVKVPYIGISIIE